MSNNINYKSESYRGAVEITPHDTNDLTDPVSALYIGGAGTVKVDTPDGTVTFNGALAGHIIPVCCTRVYATGTSATNIVGLK